MHGKFANSTFRILMLNDFFRLEFSPLIGTNNFNTASKLGFYEGFVSFVRTKGLALFLLKVEHGFAGCVIDASCNIVMPI